MALDAESNKIYFSELIHDMKVCQNLIDCAETNGHISYDGWLIVDTLITQEIERIFTNGE